MCLEKICPVHYATTLLPDYYDSLNLGLHSRSDKCFASDLSPFPPTPEILFMGSILCLVHLLHCCPNCMEGKLLQAMTDSVKALSLTHLRKLKNM